MTPFMIRFYLAAVIFVSAWIIVHFIILLWYDTCLFRHRNKKFIFMEKYFIHMYRKSCPCDFSEHRYRMRWFCDACSRMGEHCFDRPGEWKIEYGEIVPDEKKYAQG